MLHVLKSVCTCIKTYLVERNTGCVCFYCAVGQMRWMITCNFIVRIFSSYREDGELEDGEIDDAAYEDVKEHGTKGDDKQKNEKGHRKSRKKRKKEKEKKKSKRRRRDKHKVRKCKPQYWRCLF